jgi:hypothetical protein
LIGNPLGNLLGHDELDDETDDVAEEASNAALDDRHSDAVPEAQQGDDAAPRDTSIAEQPAQNRQQSVHYK